MARAEAYKAFQKLLNANGSPVGDADGVVGPKTRAGTMRFQGAFAGGRSGLPLLGRTGAAGDAKLAGLVRRLKAEGELFACGRYQY